jgi:hypothetical protein
MSLLLKSKIKSQQSPGCSRRWGQRLEHGERRKQREVSSVVLASGGLLSELHRTLPSGRSPDRVLQGEGEVPSRFQKQGLGRPWWSAVAWARVTNGQLDHI